jgi:hypothetical protein
MTLDEFNLLFERNLAKPYEFVTDKVKSISEHVGAISQILGGKDTSRYCLQVETTKVYLIPDGDPSDVEKVFQNFTIHKLTLLIEKYR